MVKTPFNDTDCKEVCKFIDMFTKVGIFELLEDLYDNKTSIYEIKDKIEIIKNCMKLIAKTAERDLNDKSYFFYLISILEYLEIDTSKYFNVQLPKQSIFDFLYIDQVKYFKNIENRKNELNFLKPFFFKH